MQVRVYTTLKQLVCVPYVDSEGRWDGKNWITLTAVVFFVNTGKGWRRYIIPAGFVTDFGSIPSPARSIVDGKGKGLLAYLIHDWLYKKNQGLSRAQSDRVMYLIHKQAEGWWTAQVVHKSVRAAGWMHFAKIEARIEKVSPRVINYILASNGLENLIAAGLEQK